MAAKSISYKDSGVDIEAGDALVEEIKKHNPRIGGFGGFVALPKGMKNPQLVVSTDGVGTKLLVADEANRYDTVGIDLVAMVVNDIIVTGAKPISFLDYYAVERLDREKSSQIIRGVVEGCKLADCELTGGETAELPGIYPRGGYDLAGFAVGVVEKKKIIDGSTIKPGDVVVGLASSGIHSNGFSLARRALLDKGKLRGAERKRAVEMLLIPTAIYVQPVLKLIRKVNVKGLAHITGGGLAGNLVRIIPPRAKAVLDASSWEVPEIFKLIQKNGPVDPAEMFRVFNMGIGMCAVVAEKELEKTIATLRRHGVHALQIGRIEKGKQEAVVTGIEGGQSVSS